MTDKQVQASIPNKLMQSDKCSIKSLSIIRSQTSIMEKTSQFEKRTLTSLNFIHIHKKISNSVHDQFCLFALDSLETKRT